MKPIYFSHHVLQRMIERAPLGKRLKARFAAGGESLPEEGGLRFA